MTPSTVISVAVIFGPTACGKTALAAQLFSSLSVSSVFAGTAEIISADSVQVYRGMPIGSAQPADELLDSLPHHLIGICPPETEFSVADFVGHADTLCSSICSRGKLPVILGGTAFYLKHFIYGMPVTPQADPAVRKALQEKLMRTGAAQMLAELERFDPLSAAKIHVHDEYRIIRAHEVYITSGKPLSSFEMPARCRSGYRFCLIFADRPREQLYRRIETRVDEMFAAGLQQEIRALVEQGCTSESPAMKAIGYREFFELSPDNPAAAPADAAAELIKRNTKRYAKRQQTFFRSFPGAHYADMSDSGSIGRITRILEEFYGER
ncbi:MAG: tRNA (adenosine(37)-N6)-dimethylallyltransferase MiaA [Treponema sp.]